jgi:hypothetical protein
LQINPCFFGKLPAVGGIKRPGEPGNPIHAQTLSSQLDPLVAAAAPLLSQASDPPLSRRPSPAGRIPPELVGRLPPVLVPSPAGRLPQCAGARGARRPPPAGASADDHGVVSDDAGSLSVPIRLDPVVLDPIYFLCWNWFYEGS